MAAAVTMGLHYLEVAMWLDEQPWQHEMRKRRIAFCLRIAGIPIEFYSGFGGTTLPTQIGQTRSYVMQRFLVEVGEGREEVDSLGGIADGGALDLSIGFCPYHRIFDHQHQHALNVGDPRAWLLMKGEKAAGWTGRPLATIPQDAHLDEIAVDTDPSPLFEVEAEPLIYVGQETIACTGWAGTGVDGDPWRLTGLTRATAGSVLARHFKDGSLENDPIIRARPIHYRGRRAVLYMGKMDLPGGGVSNWQEIRRGVLDGDPQVEGTAIRLRLVDDLSRLSNNKVDIGGRQVRLLRGHRLMEPGTASAVELAQLWSERDLVGLVGSTFQGFPPDNLVDAAAAADFAEAAWPGAPDEHPRRIPIEGQGEVAVASGTWDDPPDGIPDGLVFPDVKPRAPGGGNLELVEVKRVELLDPAGGPQVVRWPNAVTGAFTAQLMPGTVLGFEGAWADVALTNPRAGVWALSVDYNGEMPDRMLIETWREGTPRERVHQPGGRPQRWTENGPISAAGATEQCWYLVDLRDPGGPPRTIALNTSTLESSDRVQTRVAPDGANLLVVGPCLAGYQTGERFISVGPEAGYLTGRFSMQVDYTEAGGRQRTVVPIVGTQPIEVDGEVVGYALEVDEAARGSVPCFGDWLGQPACVLTPVLEWTSVEDPADILLSALLSHEGDGVALDASAEAVVAAAYNNRFGGLALTAEDVDIESFRSFAPPPGLAPWTIRHKAGDPLGKHLDQLLKATGTALVVRRRDGKARIARVKMGFEGESEAVGHLGGKLWMGDEGNDPPEFAAGGGAGEVASRIVVELGHDDGAPEPQPIAFNFRSDEAQGDREARTHTLELDGLRLLTADPGEAYTRLAPLAARVRHIANRRVKWLGSVRTDAMAVLNLGDVVTVSSPRLQGEVPTEEVVEQPARIVGVDLNWTAVASTVGLSHDGTRSAQWGPSAKVVAIIDEVTLELAPRLYALAADPVTGQARLDIDYFAAGDVVRYEPPGALNTAVELTLASTDQVTHQVVTAAPHGIGGGGLAEGGHIVPAPAQRASAAHRGFAQLGDAEGRVDGEEGATLG